MDFISQEGGARAWRGLSAERAQDVLQRRGEQLVRRLAGCLPLQPAARRGAVEPSPALESHFAPGVDSVAAGTAALTAQRRFLTAFMRRYLKLCHHNERVSRSRTASHAPRCDRSARSDSMRQTPVGERRLDSR